MFFLKAQNLRRSFKGGADFFTGIIDLDERHVYDTLIKVYLLQPDLQLQELKIYNYVSLILNILY